MFGKMAVLRGQPGLHGEYQVSQAFLRQKWGPVRWDWRDGSRFRALTALSRGPGFNFYHLRGGLQPLVTPVPGGSNVCLAYMRFTDIHAGKIPTHTIFKNSRHMSLIQALERQKGGSL